jgi:hypothetical protein
MTPDFSFWTPLMVIVGWATVIIILGVFATAFFLVALSLYSIRKGKLYFPRFLKAGLLLLEGLTKAILRFFGFEDQELSTFLIRMHNTMNKQAFGEVPVRERSIFVPQCLRSAKCPAHLTPEGLKCRSCGLCVIGRAHPLLEEMGYRFFIVPGSSFIKRMVKQYRPKAIIGVGCLAEVREGLDMADKLGLVSMGVVTTKEGCVETDVMWSEVFETAVLGLGPASVPVDLDVFPD